MITPDGHEVTVQWEWGIKLSHTGQFISFGYAAVETKDHYQQTAEFMEGLGELTEEMVHKAIGTLIIPCLRPYEPEQEI